MNPRRSSGTLRVSRPPYGGYTCAARQRQDAGNAAERGSTPVLTRLSVDLTARFGRGFSERNLRQMRLFYLGWPIRQTLSAESEADAAGVRFLLRHLPSVSMGKGQGKSPRRIHRRRAAICASLFISNRAIVALPAGVIPLSAPVSGSAAKCSAHQSVRG